MTFLIHQLSQVQLGGKSSIYIEFSSLDDIINHPYVICKSTTNVLRGINLCQTSIFYFPIKLVNFILLKTNYSNLMSFYRHWGQQEWLPSNDQWEKRLRRIVNQSWSVESQPKWPFSRNYPNVVTLNCRWRLIPQKASSTGSS